MKKKFGLLFILVFVCAAVCAILGGCLNTAGLGDMPASSEGGGSQNIFMDENAAGAVTVDIGGTVTPYDNINDAWAEAAEAESAKIKLRVNVETTDNLVVGESGNITLDLNGRKLTVGEHATISVIGNFTLESSIVGGTITCNDRVDTTGVRVDGGTFEMRGGGITDLNYGVWVQNGTFIMSGGTITECTIGVEVNDGTFEMSGGDITGSPVMGVYVLDGRFKMSGGEITDSYTGVSVDVGTFEIDGAPKIIGNRFNNVELSSDEKINVTGVLESGAEIGVSGSGEFTYGYGNHNGDVQPCNFFFDDNGLKAVVFNEDWTEAKLSEETATVKVQIGNGPEILFISLDEAFSYANENGTAGSAAEVTLLSDVTTEMTLSVLSYVTLDLNGKSLTETASAIVLDVSGNFTLIDSGTGGKIRGYEESNDLLESSVVRVCDGMFEMSGGTITVGYFGVYVRRDCIFKMSGGTITECKSGVIIEEYGMFEMSGGTITGNPTGGVEIRDGGTFEMSDGTITECTTGVWVDGGTFEIKGTPKIYGNTDANVAGLNEWKINVTGALESGAWIGVTLGNGNSGAFTSGYGYNNSEKPNYNVSPSKYFFSDDTDYAVGICDDGEAAFAEPVATVAVGTDTVRFASIGDAFSYANEKGTAGRVAEVTLLSDVTTETKLNVISYVTLDLNGYILKFAGGDYDYGDDDGDGDIYGCVIVVCSNFTLIDSNPDSEHKYKIEASGLWVFDEEAGTETFNGGVITGGKLYSKSGYGGGVYVDFGTFEMQGGAISGNDAWLGGGVYVDGGTFRMTGGKICGNYASGGGGLYIASSSIIENGEICDNTADKDGGGVIVNGTLEMSGGEIRGNVTTEGDGGGVKVWEAFLISGAPVITGNKKGSAENNVHMDDDSTEITVSGTLTEGAEIGIANSSKVVTSGYGANNTDGEGNVINPNGYFFADNANNIVRLNDDGEVEIIPAVATVKVGEDGEETGFATLYEAWTDAQSRTGTSKENPAIITMYADAGTTETLESDANKNIILDLNGCTLTKMGSDGGVITVSNGTFTLKDGKGGGKITGGYYSDTTNGAGVYVGGTFIMESGKISGNTAFNKGGGVYVADGGRFKMSGGTISGNSTNTNYGGGVYVSSGGTFEIEGTPNITGNKHMFTAENVYLDSGAKITVTGAFTDGAEIGVSLTETVTHGYSDHNSDAPYLYFFSDTGYAATLDAYGEVLIAPAVATVGTGNGEDAKTVRFAKISEAWSYAVELGISEENTAFITLLTDVTTEENLLVSRGSYIDLDLNGCVLSKAEGGISSAVISVVGTLTLNDGDLTKQNTVNGVSIEGGVITGGNNNGSGGGVLVSGTFRMTGGTIYGNYAQIAGGGVFVNGRFEMSGGAIFGNSAGMYGGGVFVSYIELRDDVDCSTFIISGAPKIYGNDEGGKVSNVRLNVLNSPPFSAVEKITVGELEEGAQIGVTRDYAEAFTEGYGGNNSAAPYRYFFADDPSLAPKLSANGEVTLTAAVATVAIGDGERKSFATMGYAWEYSKANGSSAQEAEITLLSDISVSETLEVGGDDGIVLDLNGFTLTRE